MIALRSYQQSAVEELRSVYARGPRSVLFCLPTGGGKTIVFSWIVRSATERGSQVLVLVHRAELIRQTSRALESLGIDHGVIKAGVREREAQVQVASVQTLSRRLSRFDLEAFDLVIVDEAHHVAAGSWSKVVSHFAKAKVLGVTATPCRLDGRGLSGHFEEMVLGPGPEELTELGHLARARVFAPPIGFDPKGVRRRAGDYAPEDAARKLTTRRAMGDCVEHYQRLLEGQTAIAFCCTVAHAEAVAAAFNDAGIASASIDGSMREEERERLLERLGAGELKVLTSCQLIGEGIDVPSVTGCILLRPTQSLSLFLQMVGRCLRPAGDKVAIVLDHVGNYERHGHHLEEREWTLEAGVKRRKAEASLSLWVCPKCYCNVSSRLPKCIECGHERPKVEMKIETVRGSLSEIETAAKREHRKEQSTANSYEELLALGRRRGMKHPGSWAYHVMKARHRRHA